MGWPAGTVAGLSDHRKRLPSTIDDRLALGADGLLVRPVGRWSTDKLHYVDQYMDIFSNGMKNKWERLVYIDLFSGPGRSRIRGTGREIDGSPLFALNAKYPFTHLFLNDSNADATDALRSRLNDRAGGRKITLATQDCNVAAYDARDQFVGRSLGMAFIDPTAFQITFDAIEEMTSGLRIDLIITLMTGYLRRFIEHPSLQARLDPFFGSRDWRQFVDLRASGGRVEFRHLLDHYEAQLRKLGYRDVDDHVRITNSRNSTIYHLVFASKHERGLEFFRKISQKQPSGQQQLLVVRTTKRRGPRLPGGLFT